MSKEVGNLLQKLIQEQKDGERAAAAREEHHLTSLGVPLIRKDEKHFTIDLSDLKVFSGLSTFVHLLAQEVIEQCGFGVADIMVRRRLTPQIMPEMAEMDVDWIMIYARVEAADSIPFFHRNFGQYLYTVLGAVQTPRWGGLLFPRCFRREEADDQTKIPALLFPFNLLKSGDNPAEYYMLLERSVSGRFLRVTIEDASASRLQLKHISHRVVDNLDRHIDLPDINIIADQVHQGMLREAMSNKTEYKEVPERQGLLFEYLSREGLGDLSMIHFHWPNDSMQMIRLEKRENPYSLSESLSLMTKELLLLGDRDILARLADGSLIEMVSGESRIYFETSRRNRCLNVSFQGTRRPPATKDYLDLMPALKQCSIERRNSLTGVRLFLVHHITSEVLGLIEAFRVLNCETVTTFFVRYAGLVPDDYMEALLSLPEDRFRSYCLQKLEIMNSIRGAYILSRQHSDIEGLDRIDDHLLEGQLDFMEAMRFACGHLFFKEAIQCRHDNRPLLLVEDGGYLAPLINRFCLESRTVGDVLRDFMVDDPLSSSTDSFAEWMNGIFIGSVEHTKNGHDYNLEVQKAHGRLHFPVCSIAVSRLKRGPEARACAAAILNAVENIFHRLGLVFMNRRAMILGSCGAIGSVLVEYLVQRFGADHVSGIDILSTGASGKIREVRYLSEMDPEILRDTDTFIGVIGDSIMKQDILEDILMNGKKNTLFFASGSTKTVEFKDLEKWLQNLCSSEKPRICGTDVEIKTAPLQDLQTGIMQGQSISIRFTGDSLPEKKLYLLGALTPINFLYYGIPTEIIDHVMTQLLSVTAGLTGQMRDGKPLPPKLLSVDHEIDKNAVLL